MFLFLSLVSFNNNYKNKISCIFEELRINEIFFFSGEPKSNTDTPKWTDNTIDSGTNNNNSYSKIGGVRSLYAFLGAAAALIGIIVLLVLFMVYMYSRRSLRNSNAPGILYYFYNLFVVM